MATSNWQPIGFCIEVLMHLAPRRVLDVGVGFGRWGAIVREFCELWRDRVHPDTWQVHVEGVEAFADNIGPWHESFYNRIHVGDARQLLPELPGPWDVVILGDVLEHFEKDQAVALVRHLLGKADYLLINIPMGEDFAQGERYGNPYEAHLSVWHLSDFVRPEARASRLYFDRRDRPYLSVVLSRDDPRQLEGAIGEPSSGTDLEQTLADARQAVLEGIRKSVAGASADRDRAEQAQHEAIAAEEGQAEALDRAAELDANIELLEASVAWRLLQVAGRMGLLWLPRKALRLLRRPADSDAAPAEEAEATHETAEPPRAQFNFPVAPESPDYVELLKRRPDTFGRVFDAPALMSPQERVALYAMAFSLAPGRYLEIGSCHGGSAAIVTAAMDDVGAGCAYGLDPIDHISEQTAETIASRFTAVRGASPEDLPQVRELAGGPFDLVLIDGDHSLEATLADLEGVLPIVADEAVVLVHDAFNDDVRRAIDRFVAAHADRVSDGGMIAVSPNRLGPPENPQLWGGLYMLRVRAGGGADAGK